MKFIKISEKNLRILEEIQEAIKYEEDKNSSLDEVINRALSYYGSKVFYAFK